MMHPGHVTLGATHPLSIGTGYLNLLLDLVKISYALAAALPIVTQIGNLAWLDVRPLFR